MEYLLNKLFILDTSIEIQIALLVFIMLLIIITVIILTIIKKAKK